MAINITIQNLANITKVRAHDSFLIYVGKYGYFGDLGRSHMLAAAAGLEPTSVGCTRGVKRLANVLLIRHIFAPPPQNNTDTWICNHSHHQHRSLQVHTY